MPRTSATLTPGKQYFPADLLLTCLIIKSPITKAAYDAVSGLAEKAPFVPVFLKIPAAAAFLHFQKFIGLSKYQSSVQSIATGVFFPRKRGRPFLLMHTLVGYCRGCGVDKSDLSGLGTLRTKTDFPTNQRNHGFGILPPCKLDRIE